MLLACPICQAQYEVPEDAIPEAGCEVQCSACGETWFQPHPQASFPIENIRGDQRLQDFAYIKGAIEHNSESQPGEPSNRDLQSPIFNNPTAIQRPPIAPAVAEVLRQEADREAKVRAASVFVEDQAPLEADIPPALETAQTSFPTGPAAPINALPSAPLPAPASEPDQLQADKTAPAPKPITAQNADTPSHSLGRLGFTTGVAAVMAALLFYLYAETLSNAAPSLTPYADLYTLWVDAQRQSVDPLIDQSVLWVLAQVKQVF